MTVAEAIAFLKLCPQRAEVVTEDTYAVDSICSSTAPRPHLHADCYRTAAVVAWGAAEPRVMFYVAPSPPVENT